MRKPIINTEKPRNYVYKHCFTGYVANVPMPIYTDMTYKEFEKYCDGHYTWKQIQQYEQTGSFE